MARPKSQHRPRYGTGRRASRPARPRGPWKHGPIPVVGVVGGIGSGKSTVAKLLESLGAFVIDADKVGHALLTQRPVAEAVVERFGPSIVQAPEPESESESEGEPDVPTIDRRALGAIVFSEPSSRKALEAILHPRMRNTFEKAVGRTVRRGQAKAVVLDAAILYEAWWDSLCDRVLFVDTPREIRLARLQEHRGWDEAALSARESAQMDLKEKKSRADVVVENAGDPISLATDVAAAFTKLLRPPPRPTITPKPAVEPVPPPDATLPTPPRRGTLAPRIGRRPRNGRG